MLSWRRNQRNNSAKQAERVQEFEQQVDQARHGEPEALSVLYRRFLPGIFGYVAARVPDRATAEDLTSEVFLKMVEGISHLQAKDEATFAAWLFRIARITVAGYYRKRENQPTIVSLTAVAWEGGEDGEEAVAIPAHHPDSDPVRQAEARDEWNEVVKAINTLTEEQRQVLISRLILGYDVATVARMIGKKSNAVKALQFRALHSLYRLLQQQADGSQQTLRTRGVRGEYHETTS